MHLQRMRWLPFLILIALPACEESQAQKKMRVLGERCVAGDMQACEIQTQRRAAILQAYGGSPLSFPQQTVTPIAPRYRTTQTNCVRTVSGMNCTTY